jgi:hypothetical protein
MNRFNKDLIESLTEACEHAGGSPSSVRVRRAGAAVSAPDVRAFAEACIYARSIFVHYITLFEQTPIDDHPLKEVAPYFFGDLNRMLREYLILQVCKLTDRETDARGNESLTVEFLSTNSDFTADAEAAAVIKMRADKIRQFRSKLKTARDKLIAHADRRSILNGQLLGGADLSAWKEFWLDLQVFVNVLWKRYFGEGSLYICGIAGSSDSVTLVQTLRTFAANGLPRIA